MKKHRGIKIRKTAFSAVIFGVIFSFASLIILSFICSAILMATTNPSGSIAPASLAVFIACAAISGFAITKYKGEGGTLSSLVASLVVVGIMLLVSLIGSQGKVGGAVFMNCICYITVSVFTSFIAKWRTPSRRRR